MKGSQVFFDKNGNGVSWSEFKKGANCVFGRPKYSWAIEFVENNDDKTG
jgi:hypothetical protein